MTGGSTQGREVEFLTTPQQVNHRRYEALRAFLIDGLSHAEAGDRFGYTRSAMVSLVRDLGRPGAQLFAAAVHLVGRHPLRW